MTTEFFAAIDEQASEAAAKEERKSTTLAQAQDYIAASNKVLLLTPSMFNAQLVAGRILTKAEVETTRRLATGVPELKGYPNEAVPEQSKIEEMSAAGYLAGLFYHETMPAGFFRMMHRSRLYPISEDEFDKLKDTNFDPDEFRDQQWFGVLEDAILTALETRPGMPYRKICESCGSTNVFIAKYRKVRVTYPAAIHYDPHAQQAALNVRTGHRSSQHTLQELERRFYCNACEWTSAPLDPVEYPEVHACTHKSSPIEALFMSGEGVV